jgi:hypothetical protein
MFPVFWGTATQLKFAYTQWGWSIITTIKSINNEVLTAVKPEILMQFLPVA